MGHENDFRDVILLHVFNHKHGLANIKVFLSRLRAAKIVQNASSIVISNIVVKLTSLIQSVILIRAIGIDDYGLLIFVTSVAAAITQFLDVRSNEAIVKFMGDAMAQDNHRKAATFFQIGLLVDMGVALLAYVSVTIFAPLMFSNHIDSAILSMMISVYLLAVPFTLLQDTFISIFHTFQVFHLFAVFSVLERIILLLWIVAMSPYGVVAVTAGYALAAVMAFVMWAVAALFIMRKKLTSLRGGDYRKAVSTFAPFAFHNSLTASFKTIFSYVDIFVLGLVTASANLSYYQVASTAVGLAMLVVSPVRSVIFPTMNNLWATNQIDRLRRLIRQFNIYVGAISIATLLAFLVFGNVIVVALYGEDMLPVLPIIYILAIGTGIGNQLLWVRPAALSTNQPGLLTRATFLASIVKIVLVVLLTAPFGLIGLAVAQLLTNIVNFLYNRFYIAPKLQIYEHT